MILLLEHYRKQIMKIFNNFSLHQMFKIRLPHLELERSFRQKNNNFFLLNSLLKTTEIKSITRKSGKKQKIIGE